MQKTILSLLLMASFVFALSSCKKDEANNTPKTKTQLLTLAPWKYSKLEIGSAATGPWTALTNQLACSTDDVYTFKANGTFEKDNGAVKCVSADPQVSAGNWSFSNNENTLTVEGFSISSFELSETTLSLVGQVPSNPAYYRTTFIH
jgi:hypothetical protein